jgi:O-antigen ligase
MNLRAFCTLDRLAFGLFLASGAFVILLSSNNLLGPKLSGWTQNLIYFLPWVMLWPLYSYRVITDRAHRVEIVLIGSILVLGLLNVVFSENPPKSYETMKVFLLTGIVPFWISLLLVTDQVRRNEFAVFCCFCLVIVASVEIINYIAQGCSGPGLIILFTHHPIPMGTLLILLSIGPFHCLLSESPKVKIVGWLILILGLTLIWITRRRGSFLALLVMLLVWLWHWRSKYKRYALALLMALVVLLSFRVWHRLEGFSVNNPSHRSIYHRLELYPFALHVYKFHPFLGTGLRAFVHDKFLVGYEQRNKDITDFAEMVKGLQTFDNMLVTGFIEMGSLMTLAYLALIILIIYKYYLKIGGFSLSQDAEFVRLLPLIGFAVHSLTYDSLMFPPINWLFHVQLGILAAYNCNKL